MVPLKKHVLFHSQNEAFIHEVPLGVNLPTNPKMAGGFLNAQIARCQFKATIYLWPLSFELVVASYKLPGASG